MDTCQLFSKTRSESWPSTHLNSWKIDKIFTIEQAVQLQSRSYLECLSLPDIGLEDVQDVLVIPPCNIVVGLASHMNDTFDTVSTVTKYEAANFISELRM